MGCSPSHAVIINSSPTHETICLQPRIYMVSESTLCLLRDVGELRVYNIDETDPATAVEKFRGAQEQLQNPLNFHPQLRGRERINTDDFQSALSTGSGPSSVGKDTGSQDIKQIEGDRVEIAENEEQGDSVDYQNQYGEGGITSEQMKQILKGDSQTSNAHAITVEVYSYKTSEDGTAVENERKRGKLTAEPLNDADIKANTSASVDVVSSTEQDRTSEEQRESKIEDSDVLPDEAFGWTETSGGRGMPTAKVEHLENAEAKRKEATSEDIVELVSL